MCQNL